MDLQVRTYSVLIASASPKFYDAVSPLLSAFRCGPVRCVSDLSSAKRLRAEQFFDFVIINSPLPDDQGIRVGDLPPGADAYILFQRFAVKHDIRLDHSPAVAAGDSF